MSRYKNSEKRKKAKEEKELNAQRASDADKTLKHHNVTTVGDIRSKRLSFEKMLSRVPWSENFVREPSAWKSKSFNEKRQLIDFIIWIKCKYKPPLFMFQPLLKERRTAYNTYLANDQKDYYEYKKWFEIIASGGSFYKAVKDFMSKKEAHIFLNLKNNKSIEENIWVAKCKAVGLSVSLTDIIANKLGSPEYRYSALWQEFIKFIKRFENEADSNSVLDVMDFLLNKDRENPKFELKNRTFNSIVNLSNDWHRELQLRKEAESNYLLAISNVPDFVWVDKETSTTWKITQILTLNDLYKEGKKMHHCVGGYGTLCRDGRSFIFSMEKSDVANYSEKVATIEINKERRIIQARGRCNKTLSKDETKIIRRWALINGLTYTL